MFAKGNVKKRRLDDMRRRYCKWRSGMAEQKGSSMVEYMVLGVLIIVGLFATIGALRDGLKAQYCNIIQTISESTNCP